MAYRYITDKQLPNEMIPVWMLRKAFDQCTPYDCPSRAWFNACYPSFSWISDPTESVTMEHVARVMRHCLRDAEYIDRFAFYFTGECVGPYDVIYSYFNQTFVKA